MSQFNTPDGFPILEKLGDKFLYIYNTHDRIPVLTRMSRADRNASIEDALHMIGDALISHQCCYSTALDNPWEVFFPNLVKEPSVNDKIENLLTGEIYTITRVFRNNANKDFEGVVLLTGSSPPDPDNNEYLSFLNDDRYIKFTAKSPFEDVGTSVETTDGDISNLPPMNPTVSHMLVREQPGSYAGFFKDAAKELGPMIREVFPDPDNIGYSIEVRGQIIDTLIQFDCWNNNGSSAQRLVSWFQEFMRQNSWILKKNGVQRVQYFAKLQDKTENQWRQHLFKRSIQYIFRTEILEAIRRRDLSRINVDVQVSETFTDDEPVRVIAGQTITGKLTQKKYRSIFFDNDGTYRFGRFSIIDDR